MVLASGGGVEIFSHLPEQGYLMQTNFRNVTAATATATAMAMAAFADPGTALTYQGQLSNGGTPAAGLHDLRFRLVDAASGGGQVGPTLCADNVLVVNGVFTVVLDFGDMYSAGDPRFLEVDVRADTGLSCANTTGYTTLAPRTTLTVTPFASYATQARNSFNADSASFANDSGTLGGQPSTFYRNAANLNAGTLPDARLTTNIPRLNAANTFTGTVTMSNAANVFTGSGAGLLNLNASTITTGTLNDAMLSPNVARLNAAQTFTGAQTLSNPANVLAGSGSGIIDLNASNLTSGTLPGQALSGLYFNTVQLTNANNIIAGTLSGNGLGITGMNASNFTVGVLTPARGGTGSQITSANVGDVLKWSGTTFTPQPDANTTYTAGAGLTLIGTTFSINAGQITTSMLATSSIFSATIADGAVGSIDLAANAVTNTHLALDAASMLRVSGGAVSVASGNVGIGIAAGTDRLAVNGAMSVGTVSVSGTSTLSGNVGIGGAPTSTKLNVVGGANITGAVTGGSFATPSEARSLILSAADFTGSADIVFDNGLISGTNLHVVSCGSTVLPTLGLAAVHLPHGAVVTSMTAYVIDSSVLTNVTVALLRRTPANVDTGGTMATVTTAGSDSAIRTFTDNTISGATINNDTSMYYVNATFPIGASLYVDNPNLVAVKIDYTTTTPAH